MGAPLTGAGPIPRWCSVGMMTGSRPTASAGRGFTKGSVHAFDLTYAAPKPYRARIQHPDHQHHRHHHRPQHATHQPKSLTTALGPQLPGIELRLPRSLSCMCAATRPNAGRSFALSIQGGRPDRLKKGVSWPSACLERECVSKITLDRQTAGIAGTPGVQHGLVCVLH